MEIEGLKTTVNQRVQGKLQYGSTSQKVNSPIVFSVVGVRWEIILHLPQCISSLIRDEQLCASGDAVYFFPSALSFP